MRGSVDKVTSEGSVGWLFAETHGRKPLVQAFLRHQLIGQAVADLYRPDLEHVGLGDGRHGFEIGFNEPIDPSHLPFVSVRPEGYDLSIPMFSTGGFLDLARHILAEYPTTGRHRSVLGGLWTDRMDAPALLSGRIAVGSVAAELQPALSDLIAQGFVVLHGAMAARPLGERELDSAALIGQAQSEMARHSPELRFALSQLCAFLFTDLNVRLLRALFDDHPVVYRVEVLRASSAAFAQACSFESFPSPGDCAVLYLSAATGARIDVLRNGHELGEFSQAGKSRWTRQGMPALQELVVDQRGSIDGLDLEPLDLLIVGPGAVHRAVASEDAPILRVVAAPRRVTPSRFLTGELPWLESSHVSGARLRL